MKALQAGVPQDENGVPYSRENVIGLTNLGESYFSLAVCLIRRSLAMNSLWGSSFSRSDFSTIREFVSSKFGSEHIVSKLIADDYSMANRLKRTLSAWLKTMLALRGFGTFRFLEVGQMVSFL